MSRYSFVVASLASLALARTDLSGCTSTDVSSPAGASLAWYVPGTGEICEILDCGGGRAPPKYSVPGCPQYTGSASYTPSYLPGYGSMTAAPTATATSTEAESSSSSQAMITESASSASAASTYITSSAGTYAGPAVIISSSGSLSTSIVSSTASTASSPVYGSGNSSTTSSGSRTGSTGTNGTTVASSTPSAIQNNGADQLVVGSAALLAFCAFVALL